MTQAVIDLKGVAGTCARDVGQFVTEKVARSYVVATDIGTILQLSKLSRLQLTVTAGKHLIPYGVMSSSLSFYVTFSVTLQGLSWLCPAFEPPLPRRCPARPPSKSHPHSSLHSNYPLNFIAFMSSFGPCLGSSSSRCSLILYIYIPVSVCARPLHL